MQHVVMFSAGGGSWAAAKRVVERHGAKSVTLLFTDTLSEDEDAYRFLIEGAANVLGVDVPSQRIPQVNQFPPYESRSEYKLFVEGLRLEFEDVIPGLRWIARGGDIWDVFFKERFLGNSSADPCSKRLKRQMADAWLKAECDPADTTVYVGIDKFEEHRFDDGDGQGVRPRRAADGWRYEAPLCEPPYLAPWDVRAMMRAENIRIPRLYEDGHPHNNCGGFCVKSGQAGMALLYRTNPLRYDFHEGREQDIRAFLGKDVSILTDRSGDGVKKPLTLMAFRERLDRDPQRGLALDDFRHCGCFLDDAA
jgi:hypothetical protein